MDKDGALMFKASANSNDPGVFGAVIPLVNINPDCRFFLTCFGGLMFDKNDKPQLRTFGTTPSARLR